MKVDGIKSNKIVNDLKFVETMGFRVYSDDLAKISLENHSVEVINTISPNSYGITVLDNEFKEALKQTDYLVLDGVYFAVASLLTKGKNIKRNQGPDVFYHFMERANRFEKRVFFLGSSPETLSLIKMNSSLQYPHTIVETYSPPFKPVFDFEDNALMIEKINSFKPDIVFIGMTCPKQEKWAIQNKEKLNTHLIISVGNVFDWFAGTQRSIRSIWFKLRLGWLIRIIMRPEIFRRNIRNQMRFFGHVLLVVLKIKKYD